MTTNEMVKRYIYAVIKGLPRRIQADVEMELGGLIEDMLEARCGEAAPTLEDVEAVLKDLGTPAELALKYSPDGNNSLIGPPYYSSFKLALRVVLAAVLGAVSISFIINSFTNPPASVISNIAQYVGNLFTGGMVAFAFVALLFAFFQRRGINVYDVSDYTQLPAVPQKSERISVADSVFQLIFTVAFGVVLLAFPQILGIYHAGEGWLTTVPVFNVALLQSRWMFVVALVLLGIAGAVVQLIIRRYTKGYAFTNLAINAISFGVTVLLFRGLINPEFISMLNSAANTTLFAQLENLLFTIVGLSCLLDSITALYKGFKYSSTAALA